MSSALYSRYSCNSHNLCTNINDTKHEFVLASLPARLNTYYIFIITTTVRVYLLRSLGHFEDRTVVVFDSDLGNAIRNGLSVGAMSDVSLSILLIYSRVVRRGDNEIYIGIFYFRYFLSLASDALLLSLKKYLRIWQVFGGSETHRPRILPSPSNFFSRPDMFVICTSSFTSNARKNDTYVNRVNTTITNNNGNVRHMSGK